MDFMAPVKFHALPSQPLCQFRRSLARIHAHVQRQLCPGQRLQLAIGTTLANLCPARKLDWLRAALVVKFLQDLHFSLTGSRNERARFMRPQPGGGSSTLPAFSGV